MGMRLIVVLAGLAATPVAVAHEQLSPVAGPITGVVQSAGICWDPDIEFPVPCDDDGD